MMLAFSQGEPMVISMCKPLNPVLGLTAPGTSTWHWGWDTEEWVETVQERLPACLSRNFPL